MRRLWAAVKLAVLGAALGGLIGLGTTLGTTALYRWGEGQAAAPTGEPAPGPVRMASGSDVAARQEISAPLSRLDQAGAH